MQTTYIVVKGVTGDTTQNPVVTKDYDSKLMALGDLIGFIDPERNANYDYMSDVTLISSATTDVTIGSRKAFSLGAGKTISSSNQYLIGAKSYAFMLEMTSTVLASAQTMLANFPLNPFTLTINNAGKLINGNGSGGTIYGADNPIGTKLVVVVSFDSATNTVYVDVNDRMRSSNTLGGTFIDGGISIGNSATTGQTFKCGQVLIFDKNLHATGNETQLANVKSYLATLYA